MKKVLAGLGILLSLLVVVATALPTILHAAGLHPDYEGAQVDLPGKRALIITTSHSVLAAPGETEGPETGVMASEFTHPYYSFLDAGMDVDMASIQGGQIPIDPEGSRDRLPPVPVTCSSRPPSAACPSTTLFPHPWAQKHTPI